MPESSPHQQAGGAPLAGQFAPGTLDPLSPTPTRIQVLISAGLELEEMALALGVTTTTVRNWLRGEATPRRSAVRTVDDLRQVALILSEAGIEAVEMTQWLRSRQAGALEDERPLDVIAQDPLRVLAAAHGFALAQEEREARKAGLHVVPEGL